MENLRRAQSYYVPLEMQSEYKRFSDVLQLNCIMFNVKDIGDERLGQSYLDCIVDIRSSTSEFGVFLVQCTTISDDEDLEIGVLHIQVKNGKKYFAINTDGIEEKKGKMNLRIRLCSA